MANIKDLKPGSYKVIQPPSGGLKNIKDLPPGSYKTINSAGSMSFPKEEPQEVKKTFMQKLGGFGEGIGKVLGGNVIGEALGTQIAKGNLGKTLQRKVGGLELTPQEESSITGPSGKQIAGDVLKSGLTIATAGLGPARGATAAARVLGTGAKFAGVGAGMGLAEGLVQDESAGDVVKRTLTSAAISGGLGIGVQGLAEFGKVLTSSKVGEGMINRELGVPKNVVRAGKSPAKDILTSNSINSKRGFLDKAEKTIQTTSKAINAELKQNNILHKTPDLVDQIRGQLSQVYKDALSADDVERIVDNLPISSLRSNSAMTIDRINSLRSVLDNKYLGNKKWLAAAEAVQPERITALKIAANVLRNKVQTEVPATVPFFQEMAKALTTKHVLDDELAKPHLLSNILEGMSSLIAGIGTGGMSAEGAITAASVYAAIKTLTSTPAVTAAAVGLKKAGQAAVGPAGKLLRGAARIGTQRVIQKNQKKKE